MTRRRHCPAVSPAAHARLEVVGDTEALEVIASILAALVAVDQHALLRLAAPNRHQQSVERQLPAQRGLHGPAHDLASV